MGSSYGEMLETKKEKALLFADCSFQAGLVLPPAQQASLVFIKSQNVYDVEEQVKIARACAIWVAVVFNTILRK